MNNSYDFGNPNLIAKDIANLYQSIYEAKKKVDQDQDGDNDFADVRIARMVASGVPKEEAIRRVKTKSYNEELELDEAAKRVPKKQKGAKDSAAYMAGRSDAGKRISGDEKTGPRHYTLGRSRGATIDEPTAPGAKPKNTPKVTKSELNYARTVYNSNKANKIKFGSPKGLPEEFEIWVYELVNEGYDLSEYTLEDMYEIYEESELEKKKQKEAEIAKRRARVAELKRQGRVLTSSQRTSERARARKQEQRDEKLEKTGDEIIRQIQGKPTTRTKLGGKAPEPKEEAPEATRILPTGLKRDTLGTAADKALRDIRNREVEVARKAQEVLKSMKKEEFELYDLIIEHLIEEGFVSSYDLAEEMISYMSDEWLDEIIESKKWIQKAIKKPGALSKQLGVPEEENIPLKKLNKAAKKGGKLGRRARLAKTLRKFK